MNPKVTITPVDPTHLVGGGSTQQNPVEPETTRRLASCVGETEKSLNFPRLPYGEIFPHHSPNTLDPLAAVEETSGWGPGSGTAGPRSDLDEAKYRVALETLLDGFWIASADGHFLEVDDAYVRCSGYSRQELLQLRLPDVDAHLSSPSWNQVCMALQRNARHRYESTHLRKDGTSWPVEVTLGMWPGERGRLGRTFGAVRDLTRQRQTECTLLQSESRWRRTLDNLQIGCQILDRELRITYRNAHALAQGFPSAAEADGRCLSELALEWNSSELRNNLLHCMENGHPLRMDHTLFHATERPRVLELNIQRVPDGVLILSTDVTEQRLLEEQFRQSQKMEAIGRLAGGIAHDFNNLLTVIFNYSDLLLLRCAPGSPEREWMISVRSAGERAARLTKQLLAFSRRAMVQPTTLSLNQIVKESVALLQRLIGEDIVVSTSLDHPLDPIKIDPGHLEQVIMNLAVNARDAMPAGGCLTIETRNVRLAIDNQEDYPNIPAGDYVVLRVSDTGSGMSDEVRTKIFEPFFTTKELGKGTGLGLAVVHGVMQQCSGYIRVASNLHVGTTFSLYFPAASQQPYLRLSPQPHLPRATETILLAEDERDVRTIARHALESHGYRVLEAQNGEEAVALARDENLTIDLLLTDVIMPGMDGPHLAELVNRLRPGTPAIYLSGYSDDAMRLRIADLGGILLNKPFTLQELAQTVRSILDERDLVTRPSETVG